MKKSIIRVGDRVRVKIPEFVERVGYPLTKQDFRPKADELFGNKVDDLLDKVTGKPRSHLEQQPLSYSVAHGKVMDAIAYLMLHRVGFGGRERTIHTRLDNNELGQVHYVTRKRRVWTGTYLPPSGGIATWFGEREWDHGGLDAAKIHVLLTLGSRFEIEACNVEKVPE